MKPFLTEDFMLQSETARILYHRYAEDLPIIDYHCHLSPKEIYDDLRFENLTQMWLGGKNPDGSYSGDHYKWRLMRAAGVSEDLVNGNADPYERFLAYAKTLEVSIGNPLYHWSHLELKKYFGITTPLSSRTAPEIWEKTCRMLAEDPALSVRNLIRSSNVAYVGTTDDPIDTLEWHEKLARIPDLGFAVCPSFRPDKALQIDKPGFTDYIGKLSSCTGRELSSIQDVLCALNERIDYFKAHGCKASDHGMDSFPYAPCSMETADEIFKKAMKGEMITPEEAAMYRTTVLLSLGRKYAHENIAMEIHFSVSRNTNRRMFLAEGPDTGYDIIKKTSCIDELTSFFSHLEETKELPRTIVFSLDHSDFLPLAASLGSFQSDEVPGKMQLGAAWWFLDTRDGMVEMMRSLASIGILGTFIGMLTDSRSFLSYTRHDYFRRIFCDLIGGWVEAGEYPMDEEALKTIVEGVCCLNAKRYFGIE